jgi:diguanylate cyclase (GGDEF)-like protein
VASNLKRSTTRPGLPRLFAEAPSLSVGAERKLGAGEYLWRQGDPGTHVALLLEGSLAVTDRTTGGQTVVLRTVEAPNIVGDIAAFDGRPRSASVEARSCCRLIVVAAEDFRSLLRSRPDILEELFWLQVDRVRSLTAQVTRTHQRAITDTLTRLYNYGFFRERLDLEVERARETGDPLSLVMFDIDHFKHYNDTNGHEEGNEVLRTIAEILRAEGRRGDILVRYGGEELVALFYGASESEALRFAESVRRIVQDHPFRGRENQPGGRVTISAGVATATGPDISSDTLIGAADQHLYAAKEAGRNRVLGTKAVPDATRRTPSLR